MLATYLFWALLLLPGLALLERFAKGELERGLLSAVALGYLASSPRKRSGVHLSIHAKA